MVPPRPTARHRRVLLPFTRDSLRIPDELAAEIGAAEALVVGPYGKVWRVEVGWDRDWPGFAGACGVAAGWSLVLRHRGRGVLTVKTFDDACCLTGLGAQPTVASVQETVNYKGASCKPHFISVFPTDSMGKMLIPAKFVQQYISKEHLNNRMAIISGPFGKVCPIELEMKQSNVLFAGGWSDFMAFHGIAKNDALLLRYEGNMVFTVKMFGPDGCQRGSMHKDGIVQQYELGITSALTCTEKKQETSSTSSRKYKRKNSWRGTNGKRRPNGSMTSSTKKKSLEKNCAYDIGPPAWLTKKMNTVMMRTHHLSLLRAFCNAIGFQKPCMITLRDSVESTSSWQVHGLPYKNGGCQLGSGWKKVCRDMGVKDRDVLTFKSSKPRCGMSSSGVLNLLGPDSICISTSVAFVRLYMPVAFLC